MLRIGLEIFLENPPPQVAGKRLAYLCNQASTDRSLRHGAQLLQEHFGSQLCCLFSPQHGFYSEKQDNMIESDHCVDPLTGLKVYSLYGEQRRPSEAMMAEFDILLIDLVDVGTRVYTFLYTMAYCLEAAAAHGKEVMVLDRPNPIGGESIEGNLLSPDCSSFVGLFPLPMRHGLTFGELALLINHEFSLGAKVSVVAMEGWQRRMLFRDCGFPWLAPSPNMPTPETAMVYPGQVIWEGTNISEGRGTTQPFEFFGAPFLDTRAIIEALAAIDLPGCHLRPLVFQPTSGKWATAPCHGFQLHVTDAQSFLPYRTSLALLQAISRLHPEEFRHKNPPYEYEYQRLPLDLILGDSKVRRQLAEGRSIIELESEWQQGLSTFERVRRTYFLYQ